MSFPANVYLIAFLSALGGAAASLPLWRRWCQKAGLIDDPGERKIHDRPIVLAGGLAVMTGMIVPLIVATGLLLIPLAAHLLNHLAPGNSEFLA